MADPVYSFGWVKQPYDSRDYKMLVPKKVTAVLPSRFDLAEKAFGGVPMLDQGSIGSCGPHTAVECLDSDVLAEGQTLVAPSRLFIYYNTRKLMGTVGQDSGVDNRSMMKALVQYGVCAESMWPYNDDQQAFRQQPTTDCYAAALAHKLVRYAAVSRTVDQMKGCLYSGMPFVFGFEVFKQMMSQEAAATGILADPRPGETPQGGHDVAMVGYDDSTQRFKFRNHWAGNGGRPWGDGGYGYISYGYATSSHANDFWSMDPVLGTTPGPGGDAPVDPDPLPGPDGAPSLLQVQAADDDVFRRLQASFRNVRGASRVLNDGLTELKRQHAALYVKP